MKRVCTFAAMLILALVLFGCAGSSISPVTPSNNTTGQSIDNGRMLWGMWHVDIDPGTLQAEIIPIRGAQFTANVTQFLQPPISPVNMISIAVKPSSDPSKGYFVVDVTLRHPFPSLPIYRGFDVRGILIANATQMGNQDPGLVYAGSNDTHLLNADGWSRWWNPTEFTNFNTIFGFTTGKIAPPLKPTGTLNAFKYFADDLAATESVFNLNPATRGTFATNPGVNVREYDIQFKMDAAKPVFDFNYAVDASWNEPDSSFAPTYPMDAFSLSANCQEAYQVSADFSGSNAWFIDSSQNGGMLHVKLEVSDWGASAASTSVPDEVGAIWVESSNLGITPVNVMPLASVSDGNGTTSSVFTFDLNAHPSGLQNQSLLVSVLSSNPATYAPQVPGGENFHVSSGPLAAYMFLTAPILSEPITDSPIVLSINPNLTGIDSGNLPVEVTGQFFAANAQVELIKNDNPAVIITATGEVVNGGGTSIQCSIDTDSADGAQAGVYDVRVTNPGPPAKWGELADGFTITSASSCTKVYDTEIASGDLYPSSFTFDLAFNKDGLLLAKGWDSGKMALLGYDATATDNPPPVVVVPDLSNVYYSIISIDVDDLTENIVIVSWIKDNLIETYKADGTFIQEIDNPSTNCLNSVDTDQYGAIWTVGHSEVYNPGNNTYDPTGFFINHFTWNSTTEQYEYDAAHSVNVSAQLLPYGYSLLDCAISYGDNRMFILSAAVGSGKLWCYDLSSGTPVYDAAHSVSGFFPYGMGLNSAGHWLNAADIEIDHSDLSRENCRMLLMARTWGPTYGTTLVKMYTDGTVIDTFNQNDTIPIDQMYYGMAINRDPGNPYGDFLTCVEHSSFNGNARTFHTYEMPTDW